MPFDVLTVPLEDKNLIEASAGTGKTYSIAILALRLLVEKNIPINKILMVTFTNAAVAELEHRVRMFINMSRVYINGKPIADTTIISILDQGIAILGPDVVKERIQNAYLLLDEINIKTIHSFCQQSLNEFAFESKQTFGAELITDRNPIIEQYFNIVWRNKITTLPLALFNYIDVTNLRKYALEIISKSLEGMQYNTLIKYNDITATFESLYDWDAYISDFNSNKNFYKNELKNYVENNPATYLTILKSNKPTKSKYVIKALEQGGWELFWEKLNTYKDEYIIPILKFVALDNIEDIIYELYNKQIKYVLLDIVIQYLLQHVSEQVTAHKKKANILLYNDLIEKLHHAVVKENNILLIQKLNAQYDAVFIDEFQDTDKAQFEIFQKLFDQHTILFFIGDPKQSIYAFRKADLNTYFEARKFVDNYYSMNTNFRSSATFIASMNDFFKPSESFDTFLSKSMSGDMDYVAVASPQPNRKGELYYKGKPTTALALQINVNKNELDEILAVDIYNLIHNEEYYIYIDGEKRAIKYSDIGILIRNNREGKPIKAALMKMRIPVVICDEFSIFEAEASKAMYDLLKATFTLHPHDAKRALASILFDFEIHTLHTIDVVPFIQQLELVKELWSRSGISTAILQLMQVLGIEQMLLKKNELGILSIIKQLTEALHEQYYYNRLCPEEILDWMARGLSGEFSKMEKYKARLESDEEAVQIVTIHSSKGLEYPIVFAPYLSFNDEADLSRIKVLSFRDNSSNYWVSLASQLNTQQKELVNNQIAQENRRLLYVAITRAVYQCFVYVPAASSSSKPPVLNQIVEMREAHPSEHIDITTERLIAVPEHFRSISSPYSKLNTIIVPPTDAYGTNWALLSYSRMAQHLELYKYERQSIFDIDYDNFIFKLLKGGTATGTFLHTILEKVDFSYNETWTERIQKLVETHILREREMYIKHLPTMLHHIVFADVQVDGEKVYLHKVAFNQRINEMEFHFTIKNLKLPALKQALANRYEVLLNTLTEEYLDGIMQGFIDMIFVQNEKYYILDWKSNNIGYSSEHYSSSKLFEAMSQNNYHLQYLIYTIALDKYLSTRISNYDYDKHFGGVIYVFLRGVRANCSDGIFTHKPPKEIIEQLKEIFHQTH
jgi:exodeoxyribonuclease V beta subunit